MICSTVCFSAWVESLFVSIGGSQAFLRKSPGMDPRMNTEWRSLVLVIEPRHPIGDEDENEDDEEKFARRAKILRDSSTNEHELRTDVPRLTNSRRFIFIRMQQL